jgi:hypothetical protein
MKRLPTETVVTLSPKAWKADSDMLQNTIAIVKPKASGVPASVPVGFI